MRPPSLYDMAIAVVRLESVTQEYKLSYAAHAVFWAGEYAKETTDVDLAMTTVMNRYHLEEIAELYKNDRMRFDALAELGLKRLRAGD